MKQLVMKSRTLAMDLYKVLLTAAAGAFVIQMAINLYCDVGVSVGVIV